MKYILTSYEDKIMPSKYSCFLFTFLSPKNYLNKICFFLFSCQSFWILVSHFPNLSNQLQLCKNGKK